MLSQMNFVIRRHSTTLDLVTAARRAVAEIEPTRPVGTAIVVSDLSPLMRDRQSYALAMSLFAAVAVLLAAMGVYGVVARVVAYRTREIGIRRALGARSTDVVTFLGWRMVSLVSAGLAIGLGVAVVLARLIASQLWGITPRDPFTYVACAVVVIVAAVAASIVPARRALGVDPGTVLKSE
jgi:ABC-type antimicrobial peptide transport system permease subunit